MCKKLPSVPSRAHPSWLLQVLQVGPGKGFDSISAALAAAVPGSTISIEPGR
jgi:hypothetical protein